MVIKRKDRLIEFKKLYEENLEFREYLKHLKDFVIKSFDEFSKPDKYNYAFCNNGVQLYTRGGYTDKEINNLFLIHKEYNQNLKDIILFEGDFLNDIKIKRSQKKKLNLLDRATGYKGDYLYNLDFGELIGKLRLVEPKIETLLESKIVLGLGYSNEPLNKILEDFLVFLETKKGLRETTLTEI